MIKKLRIIKKQNMQKDVLRLRFYSQIKILAITNTGIGPIGRIDNANLSYETLVPRHDI